MDQTSDANKVSSKSTEGEFTHQKVVILDLDATITVNNEDFDKKPSLSDVVQAAAKKEKKNKKEIKLPSKGSILSMTIFL